MLTDDVGKTFELLQAKKYMQMDQIYLVIIRTFIKRNLFFVFTVNGW